MKLPTIKIKHYHATGFNEDDYVFAAEAEAEIERLRKALGRIKTYTTITWIKDVCKDALEGASE